MSVNCDIFCRSIYHFQADEVGETERRELQAHLDECSRCARRLEVEEGLLRGIKTRLEAPPAPPGLETRIRQALDEATSATQRLPWFRAPWLAAAAASLLLVLLLTPMAHGFLARITRAPEAVEVTRRVTVVDHDCDRAGRTLAQQRKCTSPKHLNVLKVAGGNYWNISTDRGSSRDLVLDRRMRGQRLEVQGDYYPRIHTLQVNRARELGRAGDAARVRPPAASARAAFAVKLR